MENTATMNMNNHVGNLSYLHAKKHGFAFCAAKEKYDKQAEDKAQTIEGMEEKPSPFKTILSCVCIGIAIILGFIEGANVQTSMIGNGTFSSTTAFLVGGCFACIGLITGELLSSGLKRDEFTGKRKPTTRWWLGLLLTVVYVAGQYYLASRAGMGAGADMQATVNTLTFFILGISVIEVLFGALFLRNALQVFSVLIANVKLKILIRSMNNTSRRCEECWQRYVFEIQTGGITPQVETDAIKAARDYYNSGGII